MNIVNLTSAVSFHEMVSDHAVVIVKWVVYASVCQVIDVFGTVANVINIICFIKQGFKNSVNISLLGLAISDLGCLIPLIWSNICLLPVLAEIDMSFEPEDVQYVTGAWPHVIFSRVTSWITVFITLERCLCVTRPLKVKTIFTHTRVTVIIFCIFCILTASAFPAFYVNRLGMKFSSGRNKTIFGLVFTEDRENVEDINFAVNNVFIQLSAFVTLVVCTIMLVVKLRSKSAWRLKSATPGQFDTTSNREQKVTKMVIVIASCFITCFTPACIIMVAMIGESHFSITGNYHNVFFTVTSVGFILESASSSINIFIYYHMSSKYKATLRGIILLTAKM